MFIGKPGDLREIRDAEPGFELQTDMNVSTHKALSGAVLSTSRAKRPRQWSASWPWLDTEEADWLRDLARGVYGSPTVYAIEPTTRNYFAPQQSVGLGNLDQWDTGSNSTLSHTSSGVEWSRTATPANLTYVHPHYFGWLVMPGMMVTFAHELSDSESSIVWYDSAKATIRTDLESATSMTRAAPPNAAYMIPGIHAQVTGTALVPRATVSYSASVPSPWANGERSGGLIITSHDESIELVPYRTVSMELVEVV